MSSVLRRDRREDMQEEAATYKWRQRLEGGNHKPGVTWSHQKLEEVKRDSSLETSE